MIIVLNAIVQIIDEEKFDGNAYGECICNIGYYDDG